MPIFTILYGFTGFAIFRYSDEEWRQLQEQGLVHGDPLEDSETSLSRSVLAEAGQGAS